jgi:hypothetical protein
MLITRKELAAVLDAYQLISNAAVAVDTTACSGHSNTPKEIETLLL